MKQIPTIVKIVLVVSFIFLPLFTTLYSADDSCQVTLKWSKPVCSLAEVTDTIGFTCNSIGDLIPTNTSVGYIVKWRIKATPERFSLAEWKTINISPIPIQSISETIKNLPCDATIEYQIGTKWYNGIVTCYTEIHELPTTFPTTGCNMIGE